MLGVAGQVVAEGGRATQDGEQLVAGLAPGPQHGKQPRRLRVAVRVRSTVQLLEHPGQAEQRPVRVAGLAQGVQHAVVEDVLEGVDQTGQCRIGEQVGGALRVSEGEPGQTRGQGGRSRHGHASG